MNVPNRVTALTVRGFALLSEEQQAAELTFRKRKGSALSAFKNMMSESVYYMDRGHGVLVTDRQVIIDERRFDLAQVRDARIANRHSGHVTRLEIGMRAGSVVTLLGAMSLKVLAWSQPFAQAVFGVDMLLFTACLIGMLFLGLSDRPRQVVELRRVRGRSVELFECIDRRFADAFVEAVTDAARDCRAGHGGNARAVYRTTRK